MCWLLAPCAVSNDLGNGTRTTIAKVNGVFGWPKKCISLSRKSKSEQNHAKDWLPFNVFNQKNCPDFFAQTRFLSRFLSVWWSQGLIYPGHRFLCRHSLWDPIGGRSRRHSQQRIEGFFHLCCCDWYKQIFFNFLRKPGYKYVEDEKPEITPKPRKTPCPTGLQNGPNVRPWRFWWIFTVAWHPGFTSQSKERSCFFFSDVGANGNQRDGFLANPKSSKSSKTWIE